MFDWVEVEHLDPRLVSLDTGGKIAISSFPDQAVVNSLSAETDIIEDYTGEVNFRVIGSDLSLVYTGGVVYVKSDFVKTKVNSIWAGFSYIHEYVRLVSESGFSVDALGNDITFSPNALHSINGKVGDITFINKGNLILRTNTQQNSITISPLKFDRTNIDVNSELSSFEVHASSGFYLEPTNYPDLPAISTDASGVTYIQGLAGVAFSSLTGTQISIAKSLSINTHNFQEVEGQLQLSTSISLESGSHLLGVALPSRLSLVLDNFQPLGDGEYQQTYTHNLSRHLLIANVNISGSQVGLFTPFEKVLSYEEKTSYSALMFTYQASIETEFKYLATNPASFTGITYDTYIAVISDLMGDKLNLQLSPDGFTSLKNATSSNPTYTSLLLTIETSYPNVQNALSNLTSTKLQVYTATEILNRPLIAAFYYEFTPNQFKVYLKSPTVIPPSVTAHLLFST